MFKMLSKENKRKIKNMSEIENQNYNNRLKELSDLFNTIEKCRIKLVKAGFNIVVSCTNQELILKP